MLHAVTSAWFVFLLATAVYALSPVHLGEYDPKFVPLTAHSLVHERDLDLDEFSDELLVGHPLAIVTAGNPDWNVYPTPEAVSEARAAADTRSFDYFPWSSALFAIPAVVGADLLHVVGLGDGSTALIQQGSFDPFHRVAAAVVTAGAIAFFTLAARLMLTGSTLRRRVLSCAAGCALAFGSTAWSISSRALWQHGPSLLFVSVALYLVARLVDRDASEQLERPDVRDAALLGAAVAAAAIARPTNVWLASALLVWIFITRRKLTVALMLGAGAVGLAFVLLNLVLVGVAVPPYYAGSRINFHDDLGQALAAQWVSPSRGLLWTSPIVLLAVPGVWVGWRSAERRVLIAALSASVVGVWLSVSAFVHWWAGHSFGARFMTEAVPVLLFLALPALDRVVPRTRAALRGDLPALALVCVVALASVVMHGSAASRSSVWCWNIKPVNIDEQPDRIWSVENGQPAVIVSDLLRREHPSAC